MIEKKILGFAAPSGTGKTTLLKQLIPLLKQRGLRIGLIKHSHHDFEIDVPGKDSYELRKAGAQQVALVSAYRRVLIKEQWQQLEPSLQEALEMLDQSEIDLVLVEGFRDSAFPKIELHRPSLGKEPLFINDENIIAVATDERSLDVTDIVKMDLNDPEQIADFIIRWLSDHR